MTKRAPDISKAERAEFAFSLARSGSPLLGQPEREALKYSDDEARDSGGRWTAGGGALLDPGSIGQVGHDSSASQSLRAPKYDYRPLAVLPTGARMNPSKPEKATYYDKGQTAYVLGGTRVLTSFGALGDKQVGDHITLSHDQTQRNLGVMEITGIKDYGTGETSGVIPDKNLAHSVVK